MRTHMIKFTINNFGKQSIATKKQFLKFVTLESLIASNVLRNVRKNETF